MLLFIQVLIHDPLYLWKLSPHKAQDIQRRTEEETTTCSRAHAAQKRGADAADWYKLLSLVRLINLLTRWPSVSYDACMRNWRVRKMGCS